jgi:hypothetical protein
MGSSGRDNIYGYGRLNLDVNAINSGGGGGGGRCFIATAAYGSPMASHVQTLREFRDQYLSTTRVGKAFISFYHKYSPQIADVITKHATVRSMVRLGLLPIVGLSWMALRVGPVYTVIFMLVFSIGLTAMIQFVRHLIPNRQNK